MVLTRREKLFVIAQSIVFAALFHHQGIGLNLLIFEVFVIAWLHISGRIRFKKINLITVYSGLIISAWAVVLSYSAFAITINMLTFFTFIGVVLESEIRSLPNALLLAVNNLFRAPVVFFTASQQAGESGGTFRYIWRFRIFIIPLAIVILFVIFYANSNPIFNDLTVYLGDGISKSFNYIFSYVDGWIIFTWLLGFFIARNYIQSAPKLKRC